MTESLRLVDLLALHRARRVEHDRHRERRPLVAPRRRVGEEADLGEDLRCAPREHLGVARARLPVRARAGELREIGTLAEGGEVGVDWPEGGRAGRGAEQDQPAGGEQDGARGEAAANARCAQPRCDGHKGASRRRWGAGADGKIAGQIAPLPVLRAKTTKDLGIGGNLPSSPAAVGAPFAPLPRESLRMVGSWGTFRRGRSKLNGQREYAAPVAVSPAGAGLRGDSDVRLAACAHRRADHGSERQAPYYCAGVRHRGVRPRGDVGRRAGQRSDRPLFRRRAKCAR